MARPVRVMLSGKPAVSADGRVVAFASYAPNLVAGDTNDTIDVFVHVPAQIVVERAMYSDANGINWAAGTSATATRLEP